MAPLLSVVFVCIYGLLSLASTTAFNCIVTSTVFDLVSTLHNPLSNQLCLTVILC